MNLQALSSSTHLKHGFTLPENFAFAKTNAVSVVTIDEISTLISTYVLAFVKDGNGVFTLVCIQGMYQNDNVYVNEKGQWKIHNIPNSNKSYPFVLADSKEKENIFCFDIDSGLYKEEPNLEVNEDRFFDDNGNLADRVKNVFSSLSNMAKYKKMTISAVKNIAEVDILEPWNIELEKKDPNKTPIKGFYKINQQKLNALSGDKLELLNKSSALSIAYAQILSMPRLEIISKLYDTKNKEQDKKLKKEKAFDDIFSAESTDSLSFDF